MTDGNVQKNSLTPATASTTAGHRNELPPLQFDVNLDPPVLRPLLVGKFRIDCTKILLKGASGGVSKEFAGPGYIAQTETEGFAITIFVAGSLPFQDISMSGGVPGTLLSSAGAFSLEATDISGRTWHAGNIWMPSPRRGIGGDGYIVRASCHELVLQRSSCSIEGHSLELWSRDQLEFPFPTAGMFLPVIEQQQAEEPLGRSYRTIVLADTFQSCGFEFATFHHHGNIGLRAVGSQPPPEHFGPRVWESMLFALAGPLNWSAIRIASNGTEELRIRSPRARATPDGSPPILTRLYPPPYDTWRIFECYLKYVLAGPPPAEPKLHPLSSQVFSARNSGGASLEVQSLTLTVAVEAVLAEFFTELGKPTAAELAAINALAAHVKAWNPGEGTDCDTEEERTRKRAMKQAKGRVMGAIGGFGNAGATDRLRSLLAAGAVTKAGTDAWKELRNTAAHGDWPKLRNDHQQWANLRGTVTTLFHQLILHLIGYRGQLTDYGTHGYPLTAYPPAPVTSAIASQRPPLG